MDHHEAAAADVAGAGQRYGKGEAGGYGRINGIAALTKYFDADARSFFLLAHHHAMLCEHRQRAGERRDDRFLRRKRLGAKPGVRKQRRSS